MAEYIEVQYISPISDYKFDIIHKSYIMATITTSTHSTRIHKITIKEIGNVNDNIRAYVIGKTVNIEPVIGIGDRILSIKIFELNKTQLKLLFTGMIYVKQHEFYHKSYITMKQPIYTINASDRLKHGTYNNNTSLISEQFYDSKDRYHDTNKCILFFRRVDRPSTNILKPTIYKINEGEHIPIYNRHHNLIIKEYIPEQLKLKKTVDNIYTHHYHHIYKYRTKYCKNKSDASNNFYNTYQIDNWHIHRPLKFMPYLNSTLVSPAECRLRGFNINPTTRFNLNDKVIHINNLIKRSQQKQIYGGSGVLCRICPQDHRIIYIPYSGYLKNIRIINGNVILKIESDYFIPNNVDERDLLSVVNGHPTHRGSGVGAGTRYWPELMKPQPDTYLIYYIVFMGIGTLNNLSDLNIKLKIILNDMSQQYKSVWFEQGEELARYSCIKGLVLILVNRPIDFAADIKYYSNMSNDNQIKPIDCLIRAKNIIGILL